MYHLREWIYRGRKTAYEGKSESELTCEEAVDKILWALPEYKVVQSLCNHSKYYECDPAKNKEHATVELRGSPVGLMKCGDSLNSSYFLVDGRDIRDIFIAVYRVYYEYFESKR